MKSAYELAMERLRSEEPDQNLSEQQKAEIAEIDNKFAAKLAEREVFLNPKIAEAEASGNFEELSQLEKQLRDEKLILEEEKERSKEKVRNGR
ncbi:MAG: hypothetical protein AAF212_04780 [Verrucomicrobiota bacterium]